MKSPCCNFGHFHLGRCKTVLRGNVTGCFGPVENIPVCLNSNGEEDCVTTDVWGNYSIQAPLFTEIRIRVKGGTGISVSPPEYYICPTCEEVTDLDFVISPF